MHLHEKVQSANLSELDHNKVWKNYLKNKLHCQIASCHKFHFIQFICTNSSQTTIGWKQFIIANPVSIWRMQITVIDVDLRQNQIMKHS